MKSDKMESALRVLIAACDEALAAHDAKMDMTWYEANIAVAAFNALKTINPKNPSCHVTRCSEL